MSAPDPDAISWIAKVAATVAAPILWIHRKLDKKANKQDVEEVRGHIVQLYKNAEADRKLMRDLHDSTMLEISGGQKQIIDLLSRK